MSEPLSFTCGTIEALFDGGVKLCVWTRFFIWIELNSLLDLVVVKKKTFHAFSDIPSSTCQLAKNGEHIVFLWYLNRNANNKSLLSLGAGDDSYSAKT